MRLAIVASALILWSSSAGAQTVSQRGFIEGRGSVFPQVAPNDQTRGIGEALFREELFVKPAGWIQFAAGLDLRSGSHDQVEDEWRLDFTDRGVRRPRASIRRLTATVTAGRFTLDVGKQFIRWARADVLNPTDRFAARDFLNVIDSEFLPVTGVRPSVRIGNNTFEGVWVPRLTPSRLPLFNQRWTVVPPEAAAFSIEDGGLVIPHRSEQGVRWNHAGPRFEYALSFFDGVNHLPNIESRVVSSPPTIELTRVYPRLRTFGADAAVPMRWFSVKARQRFLRLPPRRAKSTCCDVAEIERQTGEWVLVVGYAGEVVRDRAAPFRSLPTAASRDRSSDGLPTPSIRAAPSRWKEQRAETARDSI